MELNHKIQTLAAHDYEWDFTILSYVNLDRRVVIGVQWAETHTWDELCDAMVSRPESETEWFLFYGEFTEFVKRSITEYLTERLSPPQYLRLARKISGAKEGESLLGRISELRAQTMQEVALG